MSINFENGKCIAYINGGEFNGETISIDTEKEDHKKTSKDDYNVYFGKKLVLNNGKFEPLPNFDTRSIYYICGPSGSGKSTMAANIMHNYMRLFPKKPVYIFSQLDEDKAFGKNGVRVKVDQSLVESPIDVTKEIKGGALVIFDDIDTIFDKGVASAIANIKAQILELGRHNDIYCIITSHLLNPNDRKTSRIVLNELTDLVVYPLGGSIYQITYCLEKYFGYKKKQIEEILDTNSRWVLISKTYPQYILKEKECIINSKN